MGQNFEAVGDNNQDNQNESSEWDILTTEQFQTPEDSSDAQDGSSTEKHEQAHSAESTLDYSGALKVSFDKNEDGDMTYQFDCEAPNEHVKENVIESLQRISSISRSEETPGTWRLSLNETFFIDVDEATGQVESINKLTAFETRLLAQGKENSIPFSREKLTDFRPETDLHTHLAGALEPDDIISIGRDHEAPYPISSLKKMGIDVSAYESADGKNVLMSDLSEEDLKTFKEHIMLPLVAQETFTKMEEIYALRGPLTKNVELLPDFLWALADDYQASGIKYTELSFSSFLKTGEDGAQWMQALEDTLPAIEEKTGVKIRFVAGLWRHSNNEWSLDNVDLLTSAVAKSPYIAGCDFMGHETNSTEEFKEELGMLAEYGMKEDPHFTIRIHAGENPIFGKNVYHALKAIKDEHDLAEQRDGCEYPYPDVRIGHGLYGVNEETLALAKEIGAIIEFNMSSNLALNNVDGVNEIPIKKYLDAGIDVVLGSDGHGLYSTSGEQEIILAAAAGLTPEDFEKLRATEQTILAAKAEREATHPNIEDVPALYENASYSTPDGQPRWNDEVAQRYKEESAREEAELDEKLRALNMESDQAAIAEAIKDKVPILITGTSRKTWAYLSDEDQDRIRVVTQILADVIDPDKAYIITGGTNFGSEKAMHEAVQRRNQEGDKQLVCWGTLTMDATHHNLDGLAPNTVTHASILRTSDGRKVKGWKHLPDTQIGLLGERGEMIALGGGDITKQMIQRAHNLGVSLHLMDGLKETFSKDKKDVASTAKSRALSGHDYSFSSAKDLIASIYERNPQIFVPGFNLDQVEEYLERAEEEVAGAQYSEYERTYGVERVTE
ncbi:hypothetical protein IK110_03200 [Candidatus Saccharibacteria bacterium]|nr:hypothetical protein [Candidatus Saccharibacteria bacterium]